MKADYKGLYVILSHYSFRGTEHYIVFGQQVYGHPHNNHSNEIREKQLISREAAEAFYHRPDWSQMKPSGFLQASASWLTREFPRDDVKVIFEDGGEVVAENEIEAVRALGGKPGWIKWRGITTSRMGFDQGGVVFVPLSGIGHYEYGKAGK